MSLSLILFDLDGTLIDSKQDIANSVNDALQSEGYEPRPPQIIQDFVGRGLSHLIRDVLGNPTQDEIQKVTQQFWNHYLDHLLDHTTLYPGVLDFLEEFSTLPKAVVTNKPYLFSKKILEGLGIASHFQWLIGGDSLPVQKPSPDVFKPILQDWQRPLSTVLMVGDSRIDIDCGKAAGTLTCGVTYGFRTRDELISAQADFVIDQFTDLKNLPLFDQLRPKNHK